MARTKKLTPKLLRKLVLQEKKRIRETLESGTLEDVEKVKGEEVEADEYADSIEQDIDWMKALKIHERRLKTKLKRVQENRGKLRRRIARKL
jgi:hypothetical protein